MNDTTHSGAAVNTDRELYREGTDDLIGSYYQNSLHVTAQGHIGMNVGGTVYTLPIAEWHALAAAHITALVERSSLGTPEAQALRASVSDEDAARVVARAEELRLAEPDSDEREALADWLGALPESRNVFDITDEATTVITIGVEHLADLLAAAGYSRTPDAHLTAALTEAERDALACRCSEALCPLHNEASDGYVEIRADDLFVAIESILRARAARLREQSGGGSDE